jgi:hypothetical protein
MYIEDSPERFSSALISLARILVIASLTIFLFLSFTLFSQTTDSEQGLSFSCIQDIIGPAEQKLSTDTTVEISSAPIEIEYNVVGDTNWVRIDTLSRLQANVDVLQAGGIKDSLETSLENAVAALQAVRAMSGTVPIVGLKDKLQIVEESLDAGFIDLVQGDGSLSRVEAGGLLALARPIEKRFDYLEYIAGKVRDYARESIKTELASLLRDIVLQLIDGDRAAYIQGLEELLDLTGKYRGKSIKKVEVDRIRDKCDYLLRRIQAGKRYGALQVDFTDTVFGLEFTGDLSAEEIVGVAPTVRRHTLSLETGIGFDREGWAGSVSYGCETRGFVDRLKTDDDRLSEDFRFALARELDSLKCSASISYKRRRYPNKLDDEIERNRSSSAMVAIRRLIDHVEDLGLPDEIEGDLLSELVGAGALGALVAGDRRGAVDSLEDFLDEVYDKKWEDEITPGAADRLIGRALAILPRKRIRQFDVPISLETSLYGGEIKIDMEREDKLYPADSLLDRETMTEEATYTKNWDIYSAAVSVEHAEKSYPHSPDKDSRIQEESLELSAGLAQLDVELILSTRSTTYPRDSHKDKTVPEGELSVQFEITPLDISAQLAESLTQYPNDPDRTNRRDWGLELEVELEAEVGTLQAEFGDDIRLDQLGGGDRITREKKSLRLTFEPDTDENAGFLLSSLWEQMHYPSEQEKDRTSFCLEAEIAL